MGEIPLIGFGDMVFTRFSGHIHSQTNRPKCSMPRASFFNGGVKIKSVLTFLIFVIFLFC